MHKYQSVVLPYENERQYGMMLKSTNCDVRLHWFFVPNRSLYLGPWENNVKSLFPVFIYSNSLGSAGRWCGLWLASIYKTSTGVLYLGQVHSIASWADREQCKETACISCNSRQFVSFCCLFQQLEYFCKGRSHFPLISIWRTLSL